MRINADTIFDLAHNAVEERARKDATILAAYLCGAALEKEFLIGGTMDIDLVFIHIDEVMPAREIIRITDDIHFDITHHPLKEYEPPRRVRAHPWLGPTVFDCKPLLDQRHTFDFIQASVRGMFNQPETILERARSQAEHARSMWFGIMDVGKNPDLAALKLYFKAIEHAVNSIALLSGAPLTERRLVMNFAKRAQAVGKGGLYAGLLGLLGGAAVNMEILQEWLPSWKEAYVSLPNQNNYLRLHPDRFNYYYRAFEAFLKSEEPRQMLWPFFSTWTKIVELSPQNSQIQQNWQDILLQTQIGGEYFPQKIAALDAYLDQVEETLEQWAAVNGG
ncbi:MAG: hypothetical protein ACPL4H_09020 [Anaerolineales bacterium]